MEKDLYNQKQDSYSVDIQGNINGIQIQQGTTNSSQFQNINQVFDYDKVAKIINEIDKYVPMFADTYGRDYKIYFERCFFKSIKQSYSNWNFSIIEADRCLGVNIYG